MQNDECRMQNGKAHQLDGAAAFDSAFIILHSAFPHVLHNLHNNPVARVRLTALPLQMRAMPVFSGLTQLGPRDQGMFPQVCWPAMINVIVSSAGTKLTAKAVRKLPLRNIMPSAQPTRTRMRQLSANAI